MSICRSFVLAFLSVVSVLPSVGLAQLPSGWKAHDINRPEPVLVTPGKASLPDLPPSDAIILFDGKNLDAWRDSEGNAAKWVIKDEVMESVPGSGYVFTAQAFGDVQLHVEWASPEKVEGKSQGRGNSGVFLMGLFEVQVLDSFENRTYVDGQAASLYGQYPPLVNASRKPGEWQAYDIIFRKQQFGTDGRLTAPAYLTVLHNGVLVQDHVAAYGPTSWLQFNEPKPHANKLPLSLQDHGNPVRYRNIWIRELPEASHLPPSQSYDPVVIQLNREQVNRLVGKYDRYEIVRSDRQLQMKFVGRTFDLIPHSPTEFGLKYTAGKVQFVESADGAIEALEFHLGGDVMRGKRDKPASDTK